MVENYECNFSPFGCVIHGVRLVRASSYELRNLLNFASICHYKEALNECIAKMLKGPFYLVLLLLFFFLLWMLFMSLVCNVNFAQLICNFNLANCAILVHTFHLPSFILP
jgi:hypothetical protein